MYDHSPQKLHEVTVRVIRRLHEAGFNINCTKSKLQPAQQIGYCGLTINAKSNSFNVNVRNRNSIRKALLSKDTSEATERRVVGLLMYWTFALGLTTGLRKLLHRHKHKLKALVDSGPWPLPRPPERLWAVDASRVAMVVINEKAQPIWRRKTPERWHIYLAELWALAMAIALAPRHTAIATDATAVFYGLRRSKTANTTLLRASITAIRKNITVFWLPSAKNPADHLSRNPQ